MKNLILSILLLFSCLSIAQPTPTGTYSSGKYKMYTPTAGTVSDSVVVWNGTDKLMKFVPRSLTVQTLEEVLTAGNTSTLGAELGSLTVGNFVANGYSFGVSDNYDSFYNFDYQPYSGLTLNDGAGGTSYIGFGNIELNGFSVLTTQNIDAVPTNGSTFPVSSDGTFDALATKQNILSGTGVVKSTAGTISYINGTSGQYIKGDGTLGTLPGTPSLQDVLDNNHDLTLGRNYQGTFAGASNTGNDVNGLGSGAVANNVGNSINALGNDSANGNTGSYSNFMGLTSGKNNTGDFVNIFGNGSPTANVYSSVNILGSYGIADADNQTVFSKRISGFSFVSARLSYSNVSGNVKWEMPDASGNVALVSTTISNGDTTHAPDGNSVFDALALKADLASPTFTGTPNAPTQSANDNTTKIATTAYVDAKVQNSLSASTTIAPSATAVNTALALKQDKVTGVSDTEIGYLDGVTSAIQTQLDSKVNKSRTIRGNITTITGVTIPTIAISVLIPGNTYASSDAFEIIVNAKKSVTAGAVYYNVFHDTTINGVSNTIASGRSLTPTNRSGSWQMILELSGGDAINWQAANTVSMTPFVASSAAPATTTFDTTVDQYITLQISGLTVVSESSDVALTIRPLK